MPDIKPERITQPFQLLAAWMVGFILISWELIYASLECKDVLWQCVTYTIFTMIVIFTFMRTIFLLQTKYRPEMQSGEHYQEIWKKKYLSDIVDNVPVNMMEMISK